MLINSNQINSKNSKNHKGKNYLMREERVYLMISLEEDV